MGFGPSNWGPLPSGQLAILERAEQACRQSKSFRAISKAKFPSLASMIEFQGYIQVNLLNASCT